MDIKTWCNSGSKAVPLDQEDILSASALSGLAPKNPTWKVWWLKFKKEKRRIFESPGHFQVPYDPYTYSQNFDQGCTWDEPDNLSRSFSVRFADPSRIFPQKTAS